MQRILSQNLWTLLLLAALPLAGQSPERPGAECSTCHAAASREWSQSLHSRIEPVADCQACHGPGESHARLAHGVKVLDAGTRAIIEEAIVNPKRLDATRQSMVCAQCHSWREVEAEGFRPRANYFDYFQPLLEYQRAANDASYFADGRPRAAMNEALGLWQSQCFLKGGATCASCHTRAHLADVAADAKLTGNGLCFSCHKDIAANVSAHTHHPANSAGSNCIACHMPEIGGAPAAGSASHARVVRDHSISVPAPSNTVQFGIPNACNACHRNHDAPWAAAQVRGWYGANAAHRMAERAQAFEGGRKGDARSVTPLLKIAADSGEAALVRANAIGYLGKFPDEPAAYTAVMEAMSDPDALVRATAASAIEPRAAQRVTAAETLVTMLRDPVAMVRLSAVEALVNMGATQMPPEYEDAFQRAIELYRNRLALHRRDAQVQFAGGKFLLAVGEVDAAIAALKASLKLDPQIPGKYELALALARKGDLAGAETILDHVPPNDPNLRDARQLLANLELQLARQSGAKPAEIDYLEAQVQYRQDFCNGALKLLNAALQASPQAPWTTKAQIYRAVCLVKLGHIEEGEQAMQALSATAQGRRDADLQLAYIELLYDNGKSDAALERADALLAAAPQVPQAYFWRARLLLQQGNTSDAARAAEEAVRLQPQLPGPHYLLMKIYQKQGRAQDAAKQAEWLRSYQQRSE